jgi:4-hydroxybenzoate polyprenyltransferase
MTDLTHETRTRSDRIMLSKVKSVVWHIRFRDAAIFQTPTIIGLVMSLPGISGASIGRALLVSLGSFLLMAYIFAINDWADIGLDRVTPEKRRTFLDQGIAPREMLVLSGALATASLVILLTVSWTHFVAALLITVFGLAYSFPVRGTKGKGIPVFSSLLHFATTLAAFLMGSLTFSPVDARALWVGAYLGVLISAGHLVQEVQDYAGDRLSNVRTNAVQFGQRPVFVLAFGLFGLSFLLLFGMAQAGLIPLEVRYAVLFYPLYAVWALRAYRAGLERGIVRHLRSQYRLLFAVVVLILLISDLVNRAASGSWLLP